MSGSIRRTSELNFLVVFLLIMFCCTMAFAYNKETVVSIDPLMINNQIAEDNITSEKLIFLSGSVASRPGITALTWRNNRGGGGQAILRIGNYKEPNLNGKWFIGAIPLMYGKNIITVTARDIKGVRSPEQIIVIRD